MKLLPKNISKSLHHIPLHHAQAFFLLTILLFFFACAEPSNITKASNNLRTFYLVAEDNEALDLDILATIDQKNKKIEIIVPYDTVVTHLKPFITISKGATISPDPSLAQDFTTPISYTITTPNGKTTTYTITVLYKNKPYKNNPNNAITGFNFTINNNSSLTKNITTIIDHKTLSILAAAPRGTDIKNLIPSITVNKGTTVSPDPSLAQNFTDPVYYTVTTANGEKKPYKKTYKVTIFIIKNSNNFINTFAFKTNNNNKLNKDYKAFIDQIEKTIKITLPYGTDIKNLSPTITHNSLTISPNPNTAKNFTNPVHYTTTAENNTPRIYTVTVSTVAANTKTNIHTFTTSVADKPITGNIDINNTTITLPIIVFSPIVIDSATITALTLSPYATADKKINDILTFTNNESSVTVTAQDGTAVPYTIVLELITNNPVVTTYTKTNTLVKTLGQAIKNNPRIIKDEDNVLNADSIIISVTALADTNFTWNFGTLTGEKKAVLGTLTLSKSDLKSALLRLNNQVNNNTVTFNLGINKTKSTDITIIYKPYEISSWQDLQAMRQTLNADYILTQDITFPDKSNDGRGDYNFSPIQGRVISEYEVAPFSGTFDAKTYTITNLYINKPRDDFVGLFGATSARTSITNVKLINSFVRGKTYVGGLVGLNYGTVQGYVTGHVENIETHVGGLVGYNYGGTVSGYNTGSVKGTSQFAGGLVGRNFGGTVSGYTTGKVSGSVSVGGLVGENVNNNEVTPAVIAYVSGYTTGNIIGTAALVGGLVGNNGSILNGYATGNVTGNNNVGGLVGSNGSILTGYATGNVTGNNNVGGLVGWNAHTIIGYARGIITRNTNNTTNTKFGLLVGLLTGIETGYHSGKTGESTFSGITNALGEGSNGTAITVDTNTKITDFADFDFGTDDAQWTWVADGKWPAINIGTIKTPADQAIEP